MFALTYRNLNHFCSIQDFSKFLYWQSRLYYGNRNTIKGLDIESVVANDLFKTGKLSTRAYALFPGESDFMIYLSTCCRFNFNYL